jgi:hypothetical protein
VIKGEGCRDGELTLRLSDVTLVKTQVLNANQVFTSGDVLLDSPLEAVLLPAGPGSVDTRRAGVVESGLHDLDPVARAVVGSDGARGLGNVDEARTGVLNELVVEELKVSALSGAVRKDVAYLEAQLVAGLDGVGWRAASLGSLVAAEIGRVEQLAGEGRHVRVGVLARVGIVATDGRSVHDQTVEDVVRIGAERRKQSEDSDGLHIEWIG